MRLPIITPWLVCRRTARLKTILLAIAQRYSTEEVAKALAALGEHAPAERVRLPGRRMSVRETIAFEFSSRAVVEFDVTFGFDDAGRIREMFCAFAQTQSDLGGVIEDACIAASIALQRGHSIADLAKSFGELREEGAAEGPPASPIGAIARAGARIELEAAEGRA